MPDSRPCPDTPDSHYAITRIDLPSAGTHGWQVRLQRRGVKHRKFFADSTFGTPKQAFSAAQTWRNTLLKELTRTQARTCESSRRNNSGVVGVSKITVVSSNGTVYQFWQAPGSPTPGHRRYIKFSIKRHGDRTAFKLAVEARTEGILCKE